MIIALHGFLGLSTDWNELLKNFSFTAPDLSQYDNLSFEDFVEQFNQDIKINYKKPPSLLGYSMGGRLALSALCSSPENYSSAVIISANPGINDEKSTRLAQDKKLAMSFGNKEWAALMEEWENQDVFKNATFRPKRNEVDFHRPFLAHCLQNWSLALQDNLCSKIQSLNIPICWITGGDDKKYLSMAKSIQLKHPKSKKVVIPGSGHRVPWEAQHEFLLELEKFYNDLKDRS